MPVRYYPKTLYNEALKLRSENELSYAKIGKILGISGSTVRNWCLGTKKPYGSFTEDEILSINLKKATSKTGLLNPNWKGDDASDGSARERARRLYPAPEGKQIHHIDGNPHNNESENIMFTTQREHMEIDGRIERFIERNKRGHSLQTRAKMSKSSIGRKHTPESIEKMRKIKLGKKFSDETKEKMKKAALERWAKLKANNSKNLLT